MKLYSCIGYTTIQKTPPIFVKKNNDLTKNKIIILN